MGKQTTRYLAPLQLISSEKLVVVSGTSAPLSGKHKIVVGALEKIYQRLYSKFGPQKWWPARTRFEVIVGAILTQNTNWGNVEKAIENLRRAGLLAPQRLQDISLAELASLIKPAGYFNIKAKRLKNFIEFFYQEYNGQLNMMAQEETNVLRKKLLGVNGIGPETADSILLYACDKPIFVVDAYTKRILSRHNLISPDSDYHSIQKLFMENLQNNRKMFNEYHALTVHLGKNYCKTKPLCDVCPINDISRSAYVKKKLKI